MKAISNGDVYTDALSTGTFASIPFITFGIFGHPFLMYVSSALGILLCCAFLVRFIYTLRYPSIIKSSKRLECIVSLMQIPYVAALAGMVFIDNGLDVTPILWLALALAIAVIVLGLVNKEDVW